MAAGAPKHGRPARVTQRRAPSADPSLAGLLGPACRAHPVRQNPNAGGGRPLNPVARDILPRRETGGVFMQVHIELIQLTVAYNLSAIIIESETKLPGPPQ